MPLTVKRWIHEHHMTIQNNKAARMPWIRKTTYPGANDWLLDSKAFSDGFVDLIVSGALERPGLPPIMGVAVELWRETHEDVVAYTLYYYGAMEFYADPRQLIQPPDVPLHANETIVEPPAWVLPPEPLQEEEQ